MFNLAQKEDITHLCENFNRIIAEITDRQRYLERKVDFLTQLVEDNLIDDDKK